MDPFQELKFMLQFTLAMVNFFMIYIFHTKLKNQSRFHPHRVVLMPLAILALARCGAIRCLALSFGTGSMFLCDSTLCTHLKQRHFCYLLRVRTTMSAACRSISALRSPAASFGLLSCKSGPGYIGPDGGAFSPCPQGAAENASLEPGSMRLDRALEWKPVL